MVACKMGPQEVLDFWFKEAAPERRFRTDPVLDAAIKARFSTQWLEARSGSLGPWEAGAEGALALIVLTDQFPRNMFRGEPEAFATDPLARAVAIRAIERDFDRLVSSEAQPFFYLPLMHSENLADQDRCVALTRERLGEAHYSYAYALRHRDAILRFGRFPARNAALWRQNTAEESAFLAANPAGF